MNRIIKSGCIFLFVLLIAIPATSFAKVFVLQEIKDSVGVSTWKATGGALCSLSTENLSAGRVAWLKTVFPAAAKSRIEYNLPLFNPAFAALAAENMNIWRGYGEFTFDCFNPGASPVTAYLTLQDFIGALVQGPCLDSPAVKTLADVPLYRHRQAVTLAPGLQTVSINIAVPLKAANNERDLSTLDMRQYGFEMDSGAAEATLYFDGFQLRGASDSAGTMAYYWHIPWKYPCPSGTAEFTRGEVNYGDLFYTRHTLGFCDSNATHCPFCGAQINAAIKEPASVPQAQYLSPTVRLGPQLWTSGSYATAFNEVGGYMIRHYDNNTGKMDNRGFLQYSLNGIKKLAKKAEFRYGTNVGTGLNKKFIIPIQLWSIDDKYDEWFSRPRGAKTYMTQPPLKQLIAQGGMYAYNAADIPHIALDITGYVNEQLNGDKKLSFAIVPVLGWPSRVKPHDNGYMLIYKDYIDTVNLGAGSLYIDTNSGIPVGVVPRVAGMQRTGTNLAVQYQAASQEVRFYLPNMPAHAGLAVYDLAGREVALFKEIKQYELNMDTRTLPHGVYIAKITGVKNNAGIAKFFVMK